ncbi:uncharacterized protein LOC122948502 isoform X2 [Acropora millepora]|uniref:uncharacterized protein LOC122948502 isoform X2 n=1 Tax=Acropora millepora TaxID=45264 RepID=UPI001CF580DE|nr:uncharacterized protein LOC122948502 isoform X2 [Acropora millepora]
MAKSIRSKRERKKRAAKRKKLKPKVRAKLEETLGLKDKEMAVDEETKEAEGSEEPLVKVVGNQESTVKAKMLLWNHKEHLKRTLRRSLGI